MCFHFWSDLLLCSCCAQGLGVSGYRRASLACQDEHSFVEPRNLDSLLVWGYLQTDPLVYLGLQLEVHTAGPASKSGRRSSFSHKFGIFLSFWIFLFRLVAIGIQWRVLHRSRALIVIYFALGIPFFPCHPQERILAETGLTNNREVLWNLPAKLELGRSDSHASLIHL